MEAQFYQTLKQTVYCHLCAHRCVIGPNKAGLCGVRVNRKGILETRVYGQLVAQSSDPIEKKPFYHFYPGSRSYSIATVGCNFSCRFCQNADIAQLPQQRDGAIMGKTVAPQAVVTAAEQHQCQSIAYTYTEPTIFFEYTLDTARLAREKEIKNVYVSNGYTSEAALDAIAPFLDAANVDLKAFSETFYKKYCGAALTPVLETLKRMKRLGIWLEVTTLIIPGLNDAPEELKALAMFIVNELGPQTPWHISRFHPTHRMTDRPETPLEMLNNTKEIGLNAGLHYVYMGNVFSRDGGITKCPQCKSTVIERKGFQITEINTRNGSCKNCGTPIDGIGISR